MAIFDEKIEIRERCKGVHCVDLGESCPMTIYLQKSASIQPRTSPSKFGGKYSVLFTGVLNNRATADRFSYRACSYSWPPESRKEDEPERKQIAFAPNRTAPSRIVRSTSVSLQNAVFAWWIQLASLRRIELRSRLTRFNLFVSLSTYLMITPTLNNFRWLAS